jgi:hypothetical protein
MDCTLGISVPAATILPKGRPVEPEPYVSQPAGSGSTPVIAGVQLAQVEHDRDAAAETARIGAVIELGKANPENNLTELADGWKFTAQGLRDSYDRQYWR